MKYHSSIPRMNTIRRESQIISVQSHFVVPFQCALFSWFMVSVIAIWLGAGWDALLGGGIVGGLVFFVVLVAIFRFGGVIETTFGMDLDGDGAIGPQRVEHFTRFDVGLPRSEVRGPRRIMDEFALPPDTVTGLFRQALIDDQQGGRRGVLALERSGLTRGPWEQFMERLRIHELVTLDEDNHHRLTDDGRAMMEGWINDHA